MSSSWYHDYELDEKLEENKRREALLQETFFRDFLRKLWHEPSEKPNGKDYVIVWDGKHASIARYKNVVGCKWCYLKDILNK